MFTKAGILTLNQVNTYKGSRNFKYRKGYYLAQQVVWVQRCKHGSFSARNLDKSLRQMLYTYFTTIDKTFLVLLSYKTK